MMKFVRREVKEKGADWGELRRIKRHVVLKKGLPSVPSLVINTDAGLSYLAIIYFKKEIRLYIFESEGRMLHGQSYFSTLEEVSKDLHSKSKKIARYPPLEKKLTRAQQNYQIDKKFKQIWVQLAKKIRIPKNQRRQRPLIKRILKEASGILGTSFTKNFIGIPYQSSNLEVIFYYYSLYSFLPPSIQQNKDLSEALATRLLTYFKEMEYDFILKNRASLKIVKQMDLWDSIEPSEIFILLNKVSIYYDIQWKTRDFIMLMSLSSEVLKATSRQGLPNLFCQLFSKSQNKDFLILSCFLGIPFEFSCHIPSEISNKTLFLLYDRLKHWQFSEVFSLIQTKEFEFSTGQMKAIEEAIQFQYTKVLEINLDEKRIFEIKNKSDIPITLSSAIQILPDGTETEVSFEPVTINPMSTISLDVKAFKITDHSLLRIRYSLLKSLENISRPIFVGTIVI
ncbi:MAG: hypothetical protein ACFFFH_15015 [Candidatus Thorarchaeota archaeon]